MDPVTAVALLGLFLIFLGIVIPRIPCHHGKDCAVCKEERRTLAIKAEADAERQRQLQAEYQRKAGFRVPCPDCGDTHVPHEQS